MQNNQKKLIVIVGPTATGKTKLAVKLARKFKGEIISADSRQVYRGMDIGTGKDLVEYGVDKPSRGHSGAQKGPKQVPYHLIDIINPKNPFNVAKYQKLAYKAIAGAQYANKLPFLVGGTGLYVDSVIKGFQFNLDVIPSGAKRSVGIPFRKDKHGIATSACWPPRNYIRRKLDNLSLKQLSARLQKIDPETFRIIDLKNRRRVQRALEIYYETGKKKSDQQEIKKPDLDILILGIKFPLEKIYQRIDSRLETRIKEGMIKEIKKLRKQGVSWKRLDEFGLEYRYVSRYLRGLLTYDEMVEQLMMAIHHFAKRQLTWFNRNKDISWIENIREAEIEIKRFLQK
ncbi:MAG: tRNA (adenosine(37)-N6)-dimethylallyltransferase MiaA [Patescibacteria group bacterium]|jgi:tRNA dimethylallyltransferase